MAHRRVTLVDVASRAGVSVTTASYALNGRSEQMRISRDAADRVRAVAVELGYRPNRNARSLRTAQTSMIGVISANVASGSYSSRMLTGAAAVARSSGHLLMIGETEGDAVIEAGLIEEMLDRQVDGFVIATLTTLRIRVPDVLRQQRTVLLNCLDQEGELPAVVPDELEAGRTAATALLESGRFRRIYLVGEDPTVDAISGGLRTQGVHDRLEEVGARVAGLVPCLWAVVPAYEAITRLLGQGTRPDALICLNDRVAMGAYQALAEHGLRIPDDVAVVSFDGSELATWLRPTLTSVSIPYAELGAAAVRRLIADEKGVVQLPMPLERGGSTRSFADRPTRTP